MLARFQEQDGKGQRKRRHYVWISRQYWCWRLLSLLFTCFFLHPPQGEGNILAYELSEEAPFMFQLTPHSAQGLHQALAFLPKCCCDVTKVEFMKGYRLTNTSIEPLAFKVPRIKVNRADHLLHMPPPPILWPPPVCGNFHFVWPLHLYGIHNAARMEYRIADPPIYAHFQ